jgi:hypothetical protein
MVKKLGSPCQDMKPGPQGVRPEKKTNVEKIIYEKKNFTIYRSCTVPIVVWPSFIAPFQLPCPAPPHPAPPRPAPPDFFRLINWNALFCFFGKNAFLPGGCAIVITTGKNECSSCLSGRCAIVITTGKKVLVVCLAGARSLLRPGKKRYSCLSGGCAIIITTRKEKKF